MGDTEEKSKNEEDSSKEATTEIEAEEAQKQLEATQRAELEQYIKECSLKFEQKMQLRKQNMSIQYPQEEYFTKLDSSLKKNTAFVKKVRQFTASQLDTLLKDIAGLNLTKYISEISQAIAETKLKLSDIPAAITLCTKIHQTYPEFSKTFLENWQKILQIKPTEKVSNPSKMRVDLRFFAELVTCGIFSAKVSL